MYIFVFESLRHDDPKTGKKIHSFLESNEIPCEFHQYNSKEELYSFFELVKVKLSTEDIQPFIHFDCHGNSDGIGAVHLDKTEEFISWNDILDKFIEIYRASKKRLVINMSSCEGFNATKMVAKGKPCPYDHICGSFEKIGFEPSFQAFSKFYKAISEGMDIYDAGLLVHNDPELEQLNFISINSYTLFNNMIDNYKKEELSQEKLAARKAFLLQELKKTDPSPNKTQLEYLDSACSPEGQLEILDYYEQVFFS